jgi:hypothetical protein
MIGQAFSSVGPVSGKRRRLLVLLSGSVALLAACGGPRPAQREEIDSELSRFVSQGYDPVATVATYPFRTTWQHGDEEISLDLLLPRGAVAAPPGSASRDGDPGKAVDVVDFARGAREQFAVNSQAARTERFFLF